MLSTIAAQRRLTGRVVSWQEFAEQTGRPIPPGATIRQRQVRERSDGVPASEAFPRRWSDPRMQWRGWPVRRAARAPIMAELLQPLSAARQARHALASVSVPLSLPSLSPANDNVRHGPPAAAGRVPLIEERKAGRLSDRHWQAVGWFLRSDFSEPWSREGVGQRNESGVFVPFASRIPEALWPIERAADLALRLHKRARHLGPLAAVVEAACGGAEMRDLAPKGIPTIPQRHRAAAGRIRLAAGLEICARLAEAEQRIRPIADYDVLSIMAKASESVRALASNRRMRADNDNKRKSAVA